jgi:hypothetical protein
MVFVQMNQASVPLRMQTFVKLLLLYLLYLIRPFRVIIWTQMIVLLVAGSQELKVSSSISISTAQAKPMIKQIFVLLVPPQHYLLLHQQHYLLLHRHQ